MELVLDRTGRPFDRFGSGAGRSIATSAASSPIVAARAPLLPERTARSVRVSSLGRQSPDCAERGVARAMTTPPPAERSLPRSAARARISSASPTLRSSTDPQELAGGLVAGPLRRASPLDLETEQRRDHPQALGRALDATAAPIAQFAYGDVCDPQLGRFDVVGAAQEFLLLGPRGGGDRQHSARPVDQREAGIERTGGGPGNGGKAGARSIASESASRGDPAAGAQSPRRHRRQSRPSASILSSSIPRATADSTAEGSARRPRQGRRKAGNQSKSWEMSGQK